MSIENGIVQLSPEMCSLIKTISKKAGISNEHAIRRAFALLQIAYDLVDEDKQLGIIKVLPDDSIQAVGQITGMY